jgi:hypothetical protein
MTTPTPEELRALCDELQGRGKTTARRTLVYEWELDTLIAAARECIGAEGRCCLRDDLMIEPVKKMLLCNRHTKEPT